MPSMCWAIASRQGLVEYPRFLSTSGLADPISLINLNGKRPGLCRALELGRNLSLFDPESAYRMMTDINSRDVN